MLCMEYYGVLERCGPGTGWATVFGWGKYMSLRHLDRQSCSSLADGDGFVITYLYKEPKGRCV